MSRRFIVTYDYLSGEDFGWHRATLITSDAKKAIEKLLDKTYGASRQAMVPTHVNNIKWSEAYEEDE